MSFFKKYKIQLKLISFIMLGVLVITFILYSLIPYVLNYKEGTYATDFQIELENTNYLLQTLTIALSIFAIFIILTFSKLKFLNKYNDIFIHPLNYSLKDVNILKEKLLKTPYSLIILTIIIPSICLTFIHAYTINQLSLTTLKLFLLITSLLTLFVTLMFMYMNSLFRKLIISLPYDDTTGLTKMTLKKRIFYNIIPLLVASLLFITLIGYSVVSKEVSDYMFISYKSELTNLTKYNSFLSFDELLNAFKQLSIPENTGYLFIKKDDKYYDTNMNEIYMSDFFDKYLVELSQYDNGRVYEYYGIDSQAATIDIVIDEELYTLGIYYNILSPDVLFTFTITFLFILLINILVLTLFSKSLCNDINIISDSFILMSENNNENLMKKLSLMSNDEFGKLVISYNKIQSLTESHIQQIKNNQETLMEKERLASLGQLIGGIAHNLKTPIMSISGATEGLNDLVKEYDTCIEDPEVEFKDHHEIAAEMTTWIQKIKVHTEYMSDVITAVKGQAVNFNNDEAYSFTISELLKRIDILMKHELKNSCTYLNINVNIDENTALTGDINTLIQVINNMISNSIQAYGDKKEQSIDLNVKLENNNILISIQDYGSGLPDKVKDKLFKEMITTKGKNGTGLGLYMSYSTIKAHFNGDIIAESEKNKGTTFTIILPLN